MIEYDVPISMYDFEKSWKALKSSYEKYKYFKVITTFSLMMQRIPNESLPNIFKQSLDANYLSSIISVIHSHYLTEVDSDITIKTLEFISKIPRFGMIVMFLGSDIKQKIRNLFSGLPGASSSILKIYKI